MRSKTPPVRFVATLAVGGGIDRCAAVFRRCFVCVVDFVLLLQLAVCRLMNASGSLAVASSLPTGLLLNEAGGFVKAFMRA